MGSWGPGLYSNDTALDLRSTISAIVKLPFETQRLVEIVSEVFPDAACKKVDEDYTTFWLVLADQFHKRSIDHPEVFDRSINIIDSGSDLRMQEALGLAAPYLKKREKNLLKLREKLCQPVIEKPRKTLQKPQPLIMETGDVMVFPVSEDGKSINPYFTEIEWQQEKWRQADWGAAVILACGHAFEYLAYYCPLVQMRLVNMAQSPTLEMLQEPVGWRFLQAGTSSKTHLRRSQVKKIANIKCDQQKVQDRFPEIPDGTYAAANDISIANVLCVYDGSIYNDPPKIES
ncbi:MAG: hypothetical protein P1V19_07335, partial [Gimesia sp.]|nr:hypothetical protein [Gimesia sp.]